jgi:hypothetical protein
MLNRSVRSILSFCFRAILRTAIGLFALLVMFSFFYWYNNNLSVWEARLLWPQKPFSSESFKSGSEQDRAQMVVDLISSKILLTIDYHRVSDLLGDETGDYYVTDSNFTYRLTNRGSADWILTLIPGDSGKIEMAFIRKSCCSVSKKVLGRLLNFADPAIKWFFGSDD